MGPIIYFFMRVITVTGFDPIDRVETYLLWFLTYSIRTCMLCNVCVPTRLYRSDH